MTRLTDLAQISWGFNDPFFYGSSVTSSSVFAKYDCAINGIGFMIDWNDDQLSGPNTIPLYRYGGQLDAGVRPGEASLSREDLWRRTIASLHHGAGQRWADRKDSDEFRFRTSQGIDPWTRDRVTLLKDTTQLVASTTATEAVAAGASMIYYLDNSVAKGVYVNADDSINAGLSGAITGLPGNHPGLINSLATDNSTLYVITGAASADSVYKVTAGALTATSWATAFGGTLLSTIDVAHSRVMVGSYVASTGGAGKIYDATTATPVLVGTLSPNELIMGFAEGTKVIYAAGQSFIAGQSRIYSITYDPTTATLGSPTVAGLIPMGETIRTIFGYLGFLFVGTDRGFRMCRETVSDGSLEVGPLIPIDFGVSSFTALGQYVYFSLPYYGSVAGIGRIDISVFTDADLVPAYASDLMGTGAGSVPSLTLRNGYPRARPCFVVNGTGGGIFQEHATDLVASGTLDTGLVGFDLAEQKDLSAIDLRTEPLIGTVAVQVSTDENGFGAAIDTDVTAGSSGMYIPTNHIGGSRHELRLTLTRGSTQQAPVVVSVTMLAYPAVQRGETWTLPLLVQDDIVDGLGYPQPVDFWAQVFAIRNLAIPGTSPVTVQFGSQSFQAHISDYQTSPIKLNEYGRPQATMRVQLKNMDRQVAA